jgi:hypothetical protein
MDWPNGQERTAWLGRQDEKLRNALAYYLGPAAEPVNALAGAASAMSPGADMMDMAQASGDMMQGGSFRNVLAGGLGLGAATLGMAIPGTARGITDAADEVVTGIRAYHGSPHDFDRFDMSKIGTGEGAQAYGHGLYFAENEGVAKSYREALGGRAADRSEDSGTLAGRAFSDLAPEERHALRMARDWGDPAKAASAAERQGLPGRAEILRRMASGDLPYKINQGHMYEARINANPDDFLDYDAPLEGQGEKARQLLGNKLKSYLGGAYERQIGNYSRKPAGEILSEVDRDQVRLAQEMQSAGIPGIRYLDGDSRGAGEGSRNYVVFDDKLVEIARKYGLLGALGLGGANALAGQGEEPGT